MFSASAETGNQYQFNSQALWSVGYPTYLPPVADDPLIKTIINSVHVFPWIIVSLNETDLTWDIFKPGEYMAKGPIITIQANTPVNAFVGAYQTDQGYRQASFLANPKRLQVPHILSGDTISFLNYGSSEHRDLTLPLFDKIRVASLLKDAELADGSQLSPGTSPDTVDMYWWGYMTASCDTVAPLEVTDEELGMVPGPDDAGWYSVEELNDPNAVLLIEDSVPLHNGVCFVSFERLVVEQCDSEGLYECTFTLFFAPADP
jgi:hypothetical protein